MRRPITIVDALDSLAPGEGWIIIDEDYDSIEWFREDMDQPTKEALEQEISRLTALQEEEELAKVSAEAKKQEARESALTKLAKLGLTEEEAKAVIGF